jgi:flagellar biosynthesis/type III secretory pathway protein FliH
LDELQEMIANLATIDKYWKRQAFAEGRAEGKAEGRAEGWAEALVCLLAERFGKVRPPLRKRIREADLATIDCWFKRAIVAPDLPSIFTQPH